MKSHFWGWFWIRRDLRNPRCMPRGGWPRKKPQKNSRKRRKLRTSSL